MNLDQALQTFIAESTELLQEMEDRLLGIENEDDHSESRGLQDCSGSTAWSRSRMYWKVCSTRSATANWR